MTTDQPFDATDLTYQVDPNFKPDKEGTWPYPAEKDGWVYAHDALRLEIVMWIEAMEAMLKRGGKITQEWELAALLQVAAAHLDHIHGHHSNEDDVFVPIFKTRFQYPKQLEVDHEYLEKKLEDIESCIKSLEMSSPIQPLLTHLKEYQALILPHLKHEEDVGLPLQRAYFTQQEMSPIIQKLMSRCSDMEIGSIVYAMGVDKCRNDFMVQEKIPGFVWYIQFRKCFKVYEREFATPMEALKTGVSPQKPSMLCWIL
jgi:hemerythrin-like domain-containing protein